MKRVILLVLGICLSACAQWPGAHRAEARAYADFLIGRVANLREDHRVASDRYYTALRSAPHDRVLLEGGARAALATGDVARAAAIARNAGTQDIAAVRLVRAAGALSGGQWSAARAALDQMAGAVDEQFAARFITAWAKAGEGHADDAVADLARITVPRPFSGVIAFQEALILDYAGRAPEAATAYTHAEGEGLWLAPAVMRHVELLIRTDQRDAALALLRSYSTQTQNPEIDAGLAHLNAGQPLGLAPLTPAHGAAIGLYGFGSLLTQDASGDDGLVMLSSALLLDPDIDAARIAFAQAQRDINHLPEARAALQSIQDTSPYAATAQLMTAWILRDEGKEAEAIAAARAVVDHGGGARAETALADLYRAFDHYAEAEPLYTHLITADASNWRLYFARGVVRERLDRWPEAQADLRHALELSPDQADVLNYLGYSWIDRGEHLEEGLTLIERAAELRPQSGAILDSLGWAHYKMGDYDEALGYLERAVELEPADPTLNDHLGDGYWRVGRRLEARFQWRRVLSLEPTAAARTAVEAKLAGGLPDQPVADATR